jgi:MFS family permease
MATQNQFQLLRQRRFAPFFWTQFLGAANDNIYKNALVIFVAYNAAASAAFDANTLVNLAAGLFILPFVLLSATAGQVADKFEKSRLIRFVKLLEIAIMVIGTVGFFVHSLLLLFAALLLMGVHSTLFGPVKYAILPQTLRPEELVGGNGLVEMERSSRFSSAPSRAACWSQSLASDRCSPAWRPSRSPLRDGS